MAISFSSKNHKKRHIISDINITPFVDVLLVLLIIFMIAAPMMTSNVNLDLPEGVGNQSDSKEKKLTVSIKADGAIFVQDKAIRMSNLSGHLMELTNNNLNSKIHIRADKKLDYGKVMEVVKNINLSGFSQVVLVTENQQ